MADRREVSYEEGLELCIILLSIYLQLDNIKYHSMKPVLNLHLILKQHSIILLKIFIIRKFTIQGQLSERPRILDYKIDNNSNKKIINLNKDKMIIVADYISNYNSPNLHIQLLSPQRNMSFKAHFPFLQLFPINCLKILIHL